MSRVLVMAPCLLAWGLSAASAAGVSEADLVAAFLARDAAQQRAALLQSQREAAAHARVHAPSFRVEGLHEESTSTATAFTTDVLSLGVELELSRVNATERRRAELEFEAQEFEHRSLLLNNVTAFRAQVLAAWAARREADMLAAQHERTEVLLSELERLVSAGEQSQFDYDRLQAVDATHESKTRVAAAQAQAERRRLVVLTGVEFAVPELPGGADLSGDESLRPLVLETHPFLRLLRRRVEEGMLAAELERRTHPGRLQLRAGYRVDDVLGQGSGDGYEIEAAYTLPGRSLRRRAESLALSEQRSRELDLARAERQVSADLESALARMEALQQVRHPVGADLEALRRGSLRRYRSGEADLSELIEILEELEDREALLFEAELSLRRARLDLDHASGLVTAPELAELVEGTFQ